MEHKRLGIRSQLGRGSNGQNVHGRLLHLQPRGQILFERKGLAIHHRSVVRGDANIALATKPTIAHLAVTLAAGQAVIFAHLTAPVQHTRHTTDGEAYDHEEGREGRSVQRESPYVLQDPTKS